nr:MAG TPA: hypothetical protein [Caudoviricetes sp.]
MLVPLWCGTLPTLAVSVLRVNPAIMQFHFG